MTNPLLVGGFVAAILIDFGFPIALAVYLQRRFGIRWRIFFYGALVFSIAQLLLRVPIIQTMDANWHKELTATPFQTFLWILVLAFSAAAFEEVGRWLGYRLLFKRDPKTWENALMYGVGHEAAESMLLVGLVVVISLMSYLTVTGMDAATLATLPKDQVTAIENARTQYAALQGWEPLLGGVERMFAMATQVSLSVLVLQCFTRGSAVWLWIAIGWHTLLDLGAAGFSTILKDMGTAGSLLVEGWVLLMAIVSIWIILRLRPKRGPESAEPLPPAMEEAVSAPPLVEEPAVVRRTSAKTARRTGARGR